ncbi:MAG: hypothetical protein U1E39_09450 [Planctomycetota bacterium]
MHGAAPRAVVRVRLDGDELASVASWPDIGPIAADLAVRDGAPGVVHAIVGADLVVPASAVARTLEALVRAELGADRSVVLHLRAVGDRLAAARP